MKLPILFITAALTVSSLPLQGAEQTHTNIARYRGKNSALKLATAAIIITAATADSITLQELQPNLPPAQAGTLHTTRWNETAIPELISLNSQSMRESYGPLAQTMNMNLQGSDKLCCHNCLAACCSCESQKRGDTYNNMSRMERLSAIQEKIGKERKAELELQKEKDSKIAKLKTNETSTDDAPTNGQYCASCAAIGTCLTCFVFCVKLEEDYEGVDFNFGPKWPHH